MTKLKGNKLVIRIKEKAAERLKIAEPTPEKILLDIFTVTGKHFSKNYLGILQKKDRAIRLYSAILLAKYLNVDISDFEISEGGKRVKKEPHKDKHRELVNFFLFGVKHD